MKKIAILIFCFISTLSQAQNKKIEKEERIDRSKMPEASSILIDNIPKKARKLRYFHETDGEKESYEAKFKYQGSIFSIEFEKEGNLQDIEVTLDKNQLPKPSFKKIKEYLKTSHERHKIEKIQAQYLPTDETSIKNLLLKSLAFSSHHPDNYEIIVAVKNKGKLKKFEMFFSENGKFKTQREIIRNSYDYLIF